MATRRQPASITVHFDGPIVTEDHQVTIRTLGKTLDHLQNAIDRAYLDLKYGNVLKHQRLKRDEYKDVDFIALSPREGGFIMEMVSAIGKPIADRISSAVQTAFERDVAAGELEHRRLLDQAEMRERVYQTTREAQPFDEFVAREEGHLARAFGDRAIVKEIDQVLSLIRLERHEGSSVELSTYGTRTHPTLTFDGPRAARFHAVVSERRVGEPILLTIELRSLDAGRNNQVAHGKARNIATGKEFNFLVPSPRVFDRLAKYLSSRRRRAVNVVGCPIYEYNAFDHNAGDMVLIDFTGEAGV
jgi:hypothetical protein